MIATPFHAYYKARILDTLKDADKFIPAYASSDIEVYPYQVAAAMFALRSPYLKGAILCDDGSLGKSIEAMLIITQRWYEGKHRILIVVPTPLLFQWTKIIDSRFSVPLFTIDSNATFGEQIQNGNNNPFEQEGIVITTYDFAAEKSEYISQIIWDLTVFEEAHHLRKIYTGTNKGAALIRKAAGGSFKLLLTATPMQNDIMDLYGLIYFIDENALPDADTFYKRYFRKPENYAELSERVSKFCFRTTRPQVATYVKIPERIPITFDFALTEPEQRLADMLDAYLARKKKFAFPKMELYDLTLMLFRTLSSSTFALVKTLRGIDERLSKYMEESSDTKLIDEHSFVKAMLDLAEDITENAKGSELLTVLKKGFAELRRLGANRKAIIFTENRETQKYLFALLNSGDYKDKVLTFNGEQSRDYTIIERFEKEAVILITTDIAAEGFNLEFCSFIINYDLPYNTLTIEQRIERCHRQGQQSDVVAINFLNHNNFADVRLLELINKRTLQFDGIIGLSDNVIGNLNANVHQDFDKILAAARTKDEISRAFDEVLEDYEDRNKRLVNAAEQSLFTTFDKEIADNITVTPQYIEKRVREVNNDLWELATYFFTDFNEKHDDSQFDIDDTAKTITVQGDAPILFYYWSGSRNKPYKSLKCYGISNNFKPASGKITLSSIIGRNMLLVIECADSGAIVVNGDIAPCEIGLYCVDVRGKDGAYASYFELAGITKEGKTLSDGDCRDIMALPVVSYTENGSRSSRWLRQVTGHSYRPHDIDRLIRPDEYIRRTIEETDSAVKEEIENRKMVAANRKMGLERDIEALRIEVNSLTSNLSRANSISEKILAEKRKATVQKELKKREQQLFLDCMRIDLELEEQINMLTDKSKITVEIKRQFVLCVEVL